MGENLTDLCCQWRQAWSTMGVPAPWNKHPGFSSGKSKKQQTGRGRFIPSQWQCDNQWCWKSHFSWRLSSPTAQTWRCEPINQTQCVFRVKWPSEVSHHCHTFNEDLRDLWNPKQVWWLAANTDSRLWPERENGMSRCCLVKVRPHLLSDL